jgi:hypothetical protein
MVVMKCLIGLPLLTPIELLRRSQSRTFKNRGVGVGSFKNRGVGVGSFKNRGVGVGSFKNRGVGMGSFKNRGVGVGSFKNRGVGIGAFVYRLHSPAYTTRRRVIPQKNADLVNISAEA